MDFPPSKSESCHVQYPMLPKRERGSWSTVDTSDQEPVKDVAKWGDVRRDDYTAAWPAFLHNKKMLSNWIALLFTCNWIEVPPMHIVCWPAGYIERGAPPYKYVDVQQVKPWSKMSSFWFIVLYGTKWIIISCFWFTWSIFEHSLAEEVPLAVGCRVWADRLLRRSILWLAPVSSSSPANVAESNKSQGMSMLFLLFRPLIFAGSPMCATLSPCWATGVRCAWTRFIFCSAEKGLLLL